MDLHQRQQFDVLLGSAGEAFIERIVQRCAGQDRALALLLQDRNADGVWLDQFVDAVFADSCLENADGAAWILAALRARPAAPPALTGGSTVEQTLIAWAKATFADLLYAKVVESMQRASVYG